MTILDTVPYEPLSREDQQLVEILAHLPHHIVKHHYDDHLSNFVLYEISKGFGLTKAAYMVDNPDFDHLRGVAGYCNKQMQTPHSDIWSNIESVRGDLIQKPFQDNIGKHMGQSVKRKQVPGAESVAHLQELSDLAKTWGMENPACLVWESKHGNHGVFVFEKGSQIGVWRYSLLGRIVALLSLCGL